MGEYYSWVNIDKKEYITPYCFDYGSKCLESSQKNSAVLGALKELLRTRWKNNRVMWLGDEINFPKEENSSELLNDILKQREGWKEPGVIEDMVYETYKNVSGLFEETGPIVVEDVERYLEYQDEINEYGIDINDPYKDMFCKGIHYAPYILNHTKKLYYSVKDIIVTYQENRLDHIDPLPILMSYGARLGKGEWLGDVIGVSNVEPSDYKIINEVSFIYRHQSSAKYNSLRM